jgi:hypothetical protein
MKDQRWFVQKAESLRGFLKFPLKTRKKLAVAKKEKKGRKNKNSVPKLPSTLGGVPWRETTATSTDGVGELLSAAASRACSCSSFLFSMF